MTLNTLEAQLQASLDLIALQKQKAAANAEASGIHVMPPPAPGGSESPQVWRPSSLNTWTDCQLKFYYKMILQLPEARGAALGLGTSVHAAIAENLRQKIETKEDLDSDGVRAVFVLALVEQLDTMVLQPDESADELKNVGETIIRVFMDRVAPSIQPAEVEAPVAGFIGDVPVQGTLDVIDVHGKIIDFKTAKKKPSGMTPAQMVQLTSYAMLHPAASGDVGVTTLTKGRTVACHEESALLTPADRRLTTTLYSIARDQMQAGIFSPNRASFLCSRRHCGYWQRCEDEAGGRVSA